MVLSPCYPEIICPIICICEPMYACMHDSTPKHRWLYSHAILILNIYVGVCLNDVNAHEFAINVDHGWVS